MQSSFDGSIERFSHPNTTAEEGYSRWSSENIIHCVDWSSIETSRGSQKSTVTTSCRRYFSMNIIVIVKIKSNSNCYLHIWLGLGSWSLTPLSTIFQLYHGIYIMLYREHLTMSRIRSHNFSGDRR